MLLSISSCSEACFSSTKSSRKVQTSEYFAFGAEGHQEKMSPLDPSWRHAPLLIRTMCTFLWSKERSILERYEINVTQGCDPGTGEVSHAMWFPGLHPTSSMTTSPPGSDRQGLVPSSWIWRVRWVSSSDRIIAGWESSMI